MRWLGSGVRAVNGGSEVRAGVVCTRGPEGDAQFIVWGDSHAESLLPALERLAERFAIPGRLATTGGCPPLLERERGPPCAHFNKAMRDLIVASEVKTVIQAGGGSTRTIWRAICRVACVFSKRATSVCTWSSRSRTSRTTAPLRCGGWCISDSRSRRPPRRYENICIIGSSFERRSGMRN